MEKKSKKLEMGINAQKNFAQMYEDRKMNKRIGGQVVELDPVVRQEPTKETRTWEPQSPFKIRGKSYDFAHIFIRTILTKGRTPLDHGFCWQKSRRNKGFQVRVRALTWNPPFVAGRLRLHTLALSRLLGSHSEMN